MTALGSHGKSEYHSPMTRPGMPADSSDRSSAVMTVAQALARVLDGATMLGPEQVSLTEAAGRTLDVALAAALTNPPFDASSMDGYAVRASDIIQLPARLSVIGESAAGWPFAGTVSRGEAVRIFTGAPVPDGADTVVIQENTDARDGEIIVREGSTAKGANIRARGQDFHEGTSVLPAGTRLSARHILLAATSGHALLATVRRPVVAILATGDELVEPCDRPMAGQIVSSNSYGLAALVNAAGGEAKILGIARDDVDNLASKFAEAKDADILITTGGASVGDHDLVRPALESAGAVLDFYKIAMRPGRPVFFGRLGKTRVLGLPGNPLSAMIGARVFLVPLIARLLGREDDLKLLTAMLGVGLEANGPREHYMRAVLDADARPLRVTPLETQDSAFVSALVSCNCLMIIPAHSPPLEAGTAVQVLPLDF